MSKMVRGLCVCVCGGGGGGMVRVVSFTPLVWHAMNFLIFKETGFTNKIIHHILQVRQVFVTFLFDIAYHQHHSKKVGGGGGGGGGEGGGLLEKDQLWSLWDKSSSF